MQKRVILTKEAQKAKEATMTFFKIDCDKKIKAKHRRMNKIQKMSRRTNRAA